MHTTVTRRIALALGLVGIATAGAACGEDNARSARATTAEAAAAGDLAPNPNDPYCEVERDIDAFFEDAFSALGPDAGEEEQRAAARAASQGIVSAGLMDDALEAAPDALRVDLELLSANVRAAADGNVDVFFTPESDAAGARVDAYCGLED
jgi:hypothetical protein